MSKYPPPTSGSIDALKLLTWQGARLRLQQASQRLPAWHFKEWVVPNFDVGIPRCIFWAPNLLMRPQLVPQHCELPVCVRATNRAGSNQWSKHVEHRMKYTVPSAPKSLHAQSEQNGWYSALVSEGIKPRECQIVRPSRGTPHFLVWCHDYTPLL